jgi:4-hydroxybenzoate polyprenyltransferase
MTLFFYFIRSMRVTQWIKNGCVFFPVIFALHIFQPAYLTRGLLAFLLFSLAASAVYLFNDIIDRDRDRLHPEKKYRPIAAGKLSVAIAAGGALILLATALILSLRFNRGFFYTVLLYIVINGCYSLLLKDVVIIDVMMIAVGFNLRVIAGGQATAIALSPWILIITFVSALFLGLIKRRQELVKLESAGGRIATRKSLRHYTVSLIDQMISISTATTLISYIMYVLAPETQAKFHTTNLVFTVPFWIFGIFRYLFLAYAMGKGENPAEVFYSDLPSIVNIASFLAVFLLLVKG